MTKKLKVTQDSKNRLMTNKSRKFQYLIKLYVLSLVPYTPVILNTNIEQEAPNMARSHTRQEAEFQEYYRHIDKNTINEILSQYRSTGPTGYSTSLVLARILKVKERISSDRELSDKLSNIRIYRNAIGIGPNEILALHTTPSIRSTSDWGRKDFLRSIDISSWKHIKSAYLLRPSRIFRKW